MKSRASVLTSVRHIKFILLHITQWTSFYFIFSSTAFSYYCRTLLPLETRFSFWVVVWVIVCLCSTIRELELQH